MSNFKKNHYVPQFLLKKFADKNNSFFAFNVNTKNIKYIPYKTQCQKNYFYGKDGEMEHQLYNIEVNVSPILNKIINNDYNLDLEEQIVIKQFIMMQAYRTIAALLQLNKQAEKIAKFFFNTLVELGKIDIKLKNDYVNGFVKSQSDELKINEMIEMARKCALIAKDLSLIVLNNSTINEFLISDNPVILNNLFQPKSGKGLLSAGIAIIIPICPNKAILLVDKKLYPCLKSKSVIELNQIEVLNINSQILFSCNENVYARQKVTLDNLLNYLLYKYILTYKDLMYNNSCLSRIKNSITFKEFNFKYLNSKEMLNLKCLTLNKNFIKFKGNDKYCFGIIKSKNFDFKFNQYEPEFKQLLLDYYK